MDPARIYLHGNAKDDADIGAAIDAGVGCVVIDSFDDIDRLERLEGERQRVFLRVNPEVEADTHEAVLTGHSGSKFGLRREAARRAIERLQGSDKLELTGLHVHVGSQILELEPFARALDALAGLGEFAEYDLGGGLGIPYRSTDSAPSVAVYAETLTAAVGRQLGEGVRLLVEPGRSLVGNAGITAYRVVSVKRDAVVHVAVDGGMGDNLEPSLYGTEFEARLLRGREPLERCQVVGKHCESGDVLVHDAELPHRAARRPARDAGHRRLLLHDGQQLQRPAAPAGGVLPGRGRAARGAARDARGPDGSRRVTRAASLRSLVPGLHVPRVGRQVGARAELLVVEVQVQVVGL